MPRRRPPPTRTTRSWTRAVAGAAASLTLCVPGAAAAYEYQWHAGGSLGYAVLSGDPSSHGLAGALHLTYGLNDVFNAMAQVDVVTFPGDDAMLGSAALGVGYVIDILQWVPYVGLMAGGYQVWSLDDACGTAGHPGCSATRFGGSVPFGLDYQVTRSFAVGAQGRYHLLLGPDGTAHLLTALARAEYIWGF